MYTKATMLGTDHLHHREERGSRIAHRRWRIRFRIECHMRGLGELAHRDSCELLVSVLRVEDCDWDFVLIRSMA